MELKKYQKLITQNLVKSKKKLSENIPQENRFGNPKHTILIASGKVGIKTDQLYTSVVFDD